MKRVAVLLLSIVVLGLAPALVSAQGLFGAGLPGLPSMSGFLGGYSSCGEKALGFPGPTLYVGWGVADRPTEFGAGAGGIGILGITDIKQTYRDRGVWLGVTQALPFNDYLSILASGWYLIPVSQGTDATELYNNGVLGGRKWGPQSQWWYADGLVSLGGKCGLTLLAGARYDYYTVKFRGPENLNSQVGGLASDGADVISQVLIPVIGTQYALNNATTNLVFRMVGIPTLVGYVQYNETILGVNRLEAKGNYNGGYALEAFAEYGRNFGGVGGLGIFARWQGTHGRADVSTDLAPTGLSDTFKLGVNRNAWTFGGSLTLNFNSPM